MSHAVTTGNNWQDIKVLQNQVVVKVVSNPVVVSNGKTMVKVMVPQQCNTGYGDTGNTCYT